MSFSDQGPLTLVNITLDFGGIIQKFTGKKFRLTQSISFRLSAALLREHLHLIQIID